MSEDMYRKRVSDLKKKEADLKKKKSVEERAVAKLREEIGRLERSITSTGLTSSTSAATALRTPWCSRTRTATRRLCPRRP